MAGTVEFAGMKIRTFSVPEYVEDIRASVLRKSCLTASYVHFHTLNLIQNNERVREIFDRIDTVTPDGIAIMWSARLFGQHLERSHIMAMEYAMPHLSSVAISNNWTFYLLGSEPGVAEKAADEMRRAFPSISIAGMHHGHLGSDAELKLVSAEIARLRPTIVLVGMGQPRQEEWMLANKHLIPGSAMIAVGGYLEKVSKRGGVYPDWVHRTRLYWLYRMLTEPRLLPRYTFGGMRFAWNILRARLRTSGA